MILRREGRSVAPTSLELKLAGTGWNDGRSTPIWSPGALKLGPIQQSAKKIQTRSSPTGKNNFLRLGTHEKSATLWRAAS